MKISFHLLCLLALITSALAAAPNITGKWTWIYERNGESLNIEMNVRQEAGKLSGKIIAPENRAAEIRDGKIGDDGAISFYIEYQRDSGPLRIDFSGKADGDRIAGKTQYKNDQGETRERDWNAKRAQDLSGKWDSTFKRSDGTPMESTLQLKQAGDRLTGTQSFNENETELKDGQVDADQVTFTILRERDGRTVTAKYKGKIQKNGSIKGEIESDWTGEVRKLEWEAKKVPLTLRFESTR
jgi:hypothetical protein